MREFANFHRNERLIHWGSEGLAHEQHLWGGLRAWPRHGQRCCLNDPEECPGHTWLLEGAGVGALAGFLYFSLVDQAWSRKRQPTAVFLPGKPHGQRILVGVTEEPGVVQRPQSDPTEWLSTADQLLCPLMKNWYDVI